MKPRLVILGSLLTIIAVGLVLRVYHLDRPLFFSDEAFSWRVSTCDWPDLIRRTAGDTHPIGYHVILKAWMLAFGDSVESLRGLSILLGLLCIPAVYTLCLSAISFDKTSGDAGASTRTGPLFAACVVAIHAMQLDASRTARMYALGALLAAITACVLLRAISSRRMSWWLVYGIAVAVFLYTHNFAFFTVAAQWLFIVVYFIRRRRGLPSGDGKRLAIGFAMSIIVAALLYAPWLPIFLEQAARVQEDFWISALTTRELGQSFANWATGIDHASAVESLACLVTLVVVAAVSLRSGSAGAWCLFLQAALPWLLVIGISTLGHRPLLQDRYMTFSGVALVALYGYFIDQCRRLPALSLLVLYIGSLCVYGSVQFMANVPGELPAIIDMMHLVKKEYAVGDLVVAPAPASLNIVKYYASQSGFEFFDVKCPEPPAGRRGQINHISSLDEGDILGTHGEVPAAVRRLWSVGDGRSAVQGDWVKQRTWAYAIMDKSYPNGLTLVLYNRR